MLGDEMVIPKAEALDRISACTSTGELFSQFATIFGFQNSIERIIDDFEQLKQVREVYMNPASSHLDLQAAREVRASASSEANRAFVDDPATGPLLARERQISFSQIKQELISMGAEAVEQSATDVASLERIAEEVEAHKKAYSKLSYDVSGWKIERKQQLVGENSEYKKLEVLYDATRRRYMELGKEYNEFFVWDRTPEESEIFNAKQEKERRALWEENDELGAKLAAIKSKIATQVDAEADKRYKGALEEAKEAYTQSCQKQIADAEALFARVAEKLLQTSGVSEEEAQSWADQNIVIDENVKKKLQRQGYSADTLKKDVAELYRYVGGKMGPIQFVIEGRSSRAFARGKSTIALQGRVDKQTVFHECGHLVEHWDASLALACRNFIEKRATGSPQKLKAMTGLKYSPKEAAYPDHFIDPYVGKIYSTGATEVLSMGLQSLSSPQNLVKLFKNDAEHAKLVVGCCARINPFLVRKMEQAASEIASFAKQKNDTAKWMKALSKVSTPALGKLLRKGKDGYKGYWIDSYGKTGVLFKVFPDDAGWENITYDKEAVLRSVAYLLIAKDAGLLPSWDAEESNAYSMADKYANGTVPDWFDPETPLPKV